MWQNYNEWKEENKLSCEGENRSSAGLTDCLEEGNRKNQNSVADIGSKDYTEHWSANLNDSGICNEHWKHFYRETHNRNIEEKSYNCCRNHKGAGKGAYTIKKFCSVVCTDCRLKALTNSPEWNKGKGLKTKCCTQNCLPFTAAPLCSSIIKDCLLNHGHYLHKHGRNAYA